MTSVQCLKKALNPDPRFGVSRHPFIGHFAVFSDQAMDLLAKGLPFGPNVMLAHEIRGVVRWSIVLLKPFAALVGNLPDAVFALFHTTALADHLVTRPLGGVAPTDRFAVRFEGLVVYGL